MQRNSIIFTFLFVSMAESISIHKAWRYISVTFSEMKMWEEIGKKVRCLRRNVPLGRSNELLDQNITISKSVISKSDGTEL